LHFGEGLDNDLKAATDPGTGKAKVSATMMKANIDRVYAEWLHDDSIRKFRSV
jgi:hypothetical protein